jgi:hypothetical protein
LEHASVGKDIDFPPKSYVSAARSEVYVLSCRFVVGERAAQLP